MVHAPAPLASPLSHKATIPGTRWGRRGRCVAPGRSCRGARRAPGLAQCPHPNLRLPRQRECWRREPRAVLYSELTLNSLASKSRPSCLSVRAPGVPRAPRNSAERGVRGQRRSGTCGGAREPAFLLDAPGRDPRVRRREAPAARAQRHPAAGAGSAGGAARGAGGRGARPRGRARAPACPSLPGLCVGAAARSFTSGSAAWRSQRTRAGRGGARDPWVSRDPTVPHPPPPRVPPRSPRAATTRPRRRGRRECEAAGRARGAGPFVSQKRPRPSHPSRPLHPGVCARGLSLGAHGRPRGATSLRRLCPSFW